VAVVGFAIQVDTAKMMFVSAMGACASTTGNRVQLSSSTAPRIKQQSTLRRKASRGHHVDGRPWEERRYKPKLHASFYGLASTFSPVRLSCQPRPVLFCILSRFQQG
jgi:hypothetical protein